MKKIFAFILCVLISFLVFGASQEKIFGNIKVVLHDVSFTQSFYFIEKETGKSTPIFDTVDSSSNNRFYLQTDLLMYSLTKASGVIGSQRFSETGFQVLYEIKGVATLLFDYVFSASPQAKENEFDLLDLDIKILNTHKKTQNFALKAVYDTCLGEHTPSHFSTKSEPLINTEMSFARLVEEAWVKSSDGLRSVQFNFDASKNYPTNLRLANKDLVLPMSWDINGLTGRSFNSVYSYNNSAIALYWQAQRIEPEKEMQLALSMSFATNGMQPYNKKNTILEEELVLEAPKKEPEKRPKLEEKEAPLPIIQPKDLPKLEIPLDDTSFQEENPYAYTKTITTEQLDKAYIEALLAQIEALENDESSLDRTEILKLNAELDAILKFLRN